MIQVSEDALQSLFTSVKHPKGILYKVSTMFGIKSETYQTAEAEEEEKKKKKVHLNAANLKKRHLPIDQTQAKRERHSLKRNIRNSIKNKILNEFKFQCGKRKLFANLPMKFEYAKDNSERKTKD